MKFEKVILLDDNEITQFYNKDVVLDVFDNIEIHSFIDSDEFLNNIENIISDKKLCLLLLDLNMPKSTGFEILEHLDENLEGLTDNLYVIILTSSNLKADFERSSRFASVINYIKKPLTVDKLYATVKF